jgi:hypothetical protein
MGVKINSGGVMSLLSHMLRWSICIFVSSWSVAVICIQRSAESMTREYGIQTQLPIFRPQDLKPSMECGGIEMDITQLGAPLKYC